jgi:hypothetical protein
MFLGATPDAFPTARDIGGHGPQTQELPERKTEQFPTGSNLPKVHVF